MKKNELTKHIKNPKSINVDALFLFFRNLPINRATHEVIIETKKADDTVERSI